MIKLVFAGKLRKNVDPESALDALAVLLKQDRDVIRHKLFNGKRVVIKKTDSEAVAEQWCQAFEKAGARLEVISDTHNQRTKQIDNNVEPAEQARDTNTALETDAAESATPPNESLHRRRRAYRPIGLAAVIVIAVLLGLGAWWLRPLWLQQDLAIDQQALVDALVAEHAYALGHADIGQIKSLYGMTTGGELGLGSLPGDIGRYAQSLESAGVDVHRQVKHVWATGYFDGAAPEFLLLVSGRFDVEKIEQWLHSEFLVEGDSTNGAMISWVDEVTCEKQPAQMVVVQEDYVLIGSPRRAETFRTRLAKKIPAALDLAQWQRVSSKQPLSVGVFVPANIGASLTGLEGMAAKKLGETLAPGQGLYLGVEPVLFPPGVALNGDLVSKDEAFLKDIHNKLANSLESAKANATQNWPELVTLYDRFSVSVTTGALRASVRFDENLQQDISNWISSLFTVTFGGQGSSLGPVEERLDDSPPVFANLNIVELPDYDTSLAQNGNEVHMQDTTGPFGLFIKELAVNGQGDTELKIAFTAVDLPNMSADAAGLSAHVSGVYDKAGVAVTADRGCGPIPVSESRTQVNSYRSSYFEEGEWITRMTTTGEIAITIPAGLDIGKLASVAGTINYSLPITVVKKHVSAPLAGQTIEHGDSSLRFLGNRKNAVSYKYSGPTDRLLHIYALNANGEVLAKSGGFSGPSFLGEGFSASHTYNGTVASVEVVFAEDSKRQQFPFEIRSTQPLTRKQEVFQPQPGVVDESQWREMINAAAPPADVAHDPSAPSEPTGPIRIVLTGAEFDQRRGINLGVSSYIQGANFMADGLSIGELALTELIDAQGKSHSISYHSFFPFKPEGGYWLNGEYQHNRGKPLLKGHLYIRDAGVKVVEPTQLLGALTLNAPSSVDMIPLPLKPGTTWSNGNFEITLTSWKGNSLGFKVEGDTAELVAVQALNENGDIISHPADRRWMFGESGVEVELREQPASLVLIVATELRSETFPFTLRL